MRICGIHQSRNPIYHTISSHRSRCHPRCEKSVVRSNSTTCVGWDFQQHSTFFHLSTFIETAVNVISQNNYFSCHIAARLVL
jgi:hypothetical protein